MQVLWAVRKSRVVTNQLPIFFPDSTAVCSQASQDVYLKYLITWLTFIFSVCALCKSHEVYGSHALYHITWVTTCNKCVSICNCFLL